VTVTSGTLRSALVGGSAEWIVALPPGAGDTSTLPVCYCLPGRGSTAHGVVADLRIPDYVAEAAEERDAQPFVVASLDAGESYWHRRANGEDRQAALLDELVPLVESRLGIAQPRRALLGWSMGGYGAILIGERFPERFRAIAAASPALWTSAGDTAEGAFDDADDYRRNDVFTHPERLRRLAVRIDCGSSDPFHDATVAFRGRLRPTPAGGIDAGCHTGDYWRRIAPAQVDFLAAALAA
jgi:enterochelin esterase-like enzyme